MNTTDHVCQFCLESQNSEKSKFYNVYGDVIQDRIVLENQHFICIPTVGQIVQGSLLIIPREHRYTIASMPQEQICAFKDLLSKARSFFEKSIVFEHGCWPKVGHNCGIYHAHAHIVPMQNFHTVNNLVKQPIKSIDLDKCFDELYSISEYILLIDSGNVAFYMLPSEGNAEHFKSQYFRKWLVENFHPEKDYDWKSYVNKKEKELIEVVRNLKNQTATSELL